MLRYSKHSGQQRHRKVFDSIIMITTRQLEHTFFMASHIAVNGVHAIFIYQWRSPSEGLEVCRCIMNNVFMDDLNLNLFIRY